MELLTWITTAVIVIVVGGVGAMKATGNTEVIEQAKRLGYENIRVSTGILEVLAAAAVLLGALVSDFEWLGTVAAIGNHPNDARRRFLSPACRRQVPNRPVDHCLDRLCCLPGRPQRELDGSLRCGT